MADLCCEYNVGSLFTINDQSAGVDRLVLDDDGVKGLDGAPVRSQVDPRGQIDGGIVHPKRLGPRKIPFKGFLHIQSVIENPPGSLFFAAVNALEDSITSALESILNTDTTLSWTPTGVGGRSIVVTYGVPGEEIQFTGSMLAPRFSFSLIAADPDIS